MTKTLVPLLVVVLVLAGILFVVQDAQAKPAVVWQPERVDIGVPAGDMLSAELVVVANNDLAATRVEIVPALQPYVASITPTTLPALRKGQSAKVALVFSVASGTPAQTVEGTLHLRQAAGSNGTQAKPLPIMLTIGSLRYPPDPGEAGKVTLEGIDSDRDGLRDDVERYIALTYPDKPLIRAALRQDALLEQRALLVANERTESRSIVKEIHKADECMEYLVGFAGHAMRKMLRAEILNTEARSRAYIKFNSQLGGTVSSVPTIPDPATCDFDISAGGDA